MPSTADLLDLNSISLAPTSGKVTFSMAFYKRCFLLKVKQESTLPRPRPLRLKSANHKVPIIAKSKMTDTMDIAIEDAELLESLENMEVSV